MSAKPVEVAIALWGDRHLPVSAVAAQARALEASGVVDGILLADQLVNFIPQQLWTPRNTPAASFLGDPDSHSDAFTLAAYLSALTPSLSLSVSTDSVRRGPAELIQTMLTLADITQGRVTFHIGGGEVKQCKPYGHKRSQGLSRMEDLFKIYKSWSEDHGPLTHQGNHWSFDKATIGRAMPHKPRIWGLGAGPKLIDHATTYCDGLAATCPPVWGGPEAFGKARAEILEQVRRKGRDPSKFNTAVWFPVMLTENPEQVQLALANPLVKWMSGIFGRIDAKLWREVGLESPIPEDWNYFTHFLPYDTPQSFIDSVLAKTTDEHVRQGWLIGTPKEVAAMIQRYIDAGADWVCPMDYLPLVLDPSEAEAAFARSIELCRLIKAGG
ncbi:MAG: luciferase family protein [Nevskia sp.]|nr:luciferase family protein [Nevskia sp.]